MVSRKVESANPMEVYSTSSWIYSCSVPSKWNLGKETLRISLSTEKFRSLDDIRAVNMPKCVGSGLVVFSGSGAIALADNLVHKILGRKGKEHRRSLREIIFPKRRKGLKE